MDIQTGNVGPGPAAKVLVLNLHSATGPTRPSGVFASPRLDAGFLIGRNNELIVLQRLTLPVAGIQIQQAAGFVSEVGIAREDPTTVVPRTNSILM